MSVLPTTRAGRRRVDAPCGRAGRRWRRRARPSGRCRPCRRRRGPATRASIAQPAASAPASRQASTRCLERLEAARACGERTYHCAAARAGHDVRACRRLGEDAVDALVGPDVLAQRGHVHVAEHRGVEGVAALLRGGRGVGGLPVVGRRRSCWMAMASMRGRSAPAGCTIIAASTPSNAPRSAMRTLPPPPSSAGVPRITHPAAELVGQRGGGEPGAEPGGGDDVVAAGVADARAGRRTRTARRSSGPPSPARAANAVSSP